MGPHATLQYAVQLGNGPFLIGGNFNFPLRDLRRGTPLVLCHLLTQWLIDVYVTFARDLARC